MVRYADTFMFPAVVQALSNAGIDPDPAASFPSIGLEVDDQGEILSLGETVSVIVRDLAVSVSLPKISSLWIGDRTPPSFSRGPTPEYLPFFAMIELTAADFCSVSGRIVTDQEFERLYDLLRRRPDGSDSEPIFEYLQAAVRLYLALHDGSRAEFEAVVRRLAQSARTFSEGYASRNYWHHALKQFVNSDD